MIESIWHHNTIQEFSREIHRKHLTEDDFDDEILFEDDDYWISKKINKSKFLLHSDNYKDLPIVYRNPLNSEYKNLFERIHLNNRTHYLIKSIKKAIIEPKQSMHPSEFFESFLNIPHSKPIHWNLYKGICIGGNFTKTMVRVSARTQFGKTSIPDILRELTKQTRVIVPASFPALLRKLSSTKMVFITEPKKFEGFNTFLEIVGDRSNHFENPKLESKAAGTENEYDVSNLSILIGYNHLDEFKNQDDFFDNMFNHWIQQRFIPFLFEGNVKHFKKEKYNDEVHDRLLEWLRNWNYYKLNWQNHLHEYSVSLSPMKWGIRYIETFEELIKIFDFISKDEKQFDEYINELIKCYQAYIRMVNNNITLEESFIPKRIERIKEMPLIVTEESIVIDNNQEEKISRKGSPLFTSPLDYILTKDKHEIGIDEFLNKYDEKTMNTLLRNGDIFKIEDHKLKVLE